MERRTTSHSYTRCNKRLNDGMLNWVDFTRAPLKIEPILKAPKRNARLDVDIEEPFFQPQRLRITLKSSLKSGNNLSIFDGNFHLKNYFLANPS